jgi:transcriptional regulator with XRE-family HTH domain
MSKPHTSIDPVRLAELRRRAGLSQPQLASKANVPVGTLRNLEQGHRTDPHVSTAAALAHALDTTVDQLLRQ